MSVKRIEDVPLEAVPGSKGVERQVLIGPDEAPNFALRRFVMAPGGGMPKHTNTVEHEQYVLRGRAEVGLGNEAFEVGPGQAVYIPPRVPHWYRVLSDEPFEVICIVPNGPDRVEVLGDPLRASRTDGTS